jgi:hypothetical protein
VTKKRVAMPAIPERERWAGDTGFRLGEFTEADMEAFQAGTVPDWLKRTAASLLAAQKKYTITFEPQEPGFRDEQAS